MPELPHPSNGDAILRALSGGPMSCRELDRALGGVHAADLWKLEATRKIVLDPDRFPGEYVPGNPLIARLPDDARPWPGWAAWNA